MADDEKSKNQILQALDALSHTLYQARSTRRTTSLALPRSADGDGEDAAGVDAVPAAEARPLSRRLSLMSPFRSRSKLDKHGKDDDDEDDEDDDGGGDAALLKLKHHSFAAVTPGAAAADEEKKGIWAWKPIRTLSHIGMHRVGCLFSLEVVAAQGLPPSMNGLRLAVAVRRKETRDGALQTMPARVQKGAADFDETLYVRCALYCSGGGATGRPLKFEPRPFLLSAVAVDAPELDFGQNAVDLSVFVKQFTDKCQQGECPRQWDMTLPLAGKAKDGELVVKLAFTVLEDGGIGLINAQPDGADKTTNSSSSSSFARKVSKSSFSIMSPKMLRSKLSFTPKRGVLTPDLKDIDNFKLDEPTPAAEVKAAQQKETEAKLEEVKVEQQKETTQREPELVKEAEQQKETTQRETDVVKEEKKQEPQHEPAEAKEEQPKEPEPEPEDVSPDDAELPEFEVVDKGIEGQEEAEAEQAMEATMLATLSDPYAAANKSVEPAETNGEEVTGESTLQLPEQEDGKAAAAKSSPPPRIGWRIVAMIVTPIAVIVGKTLATAR